MVSPQPLLGRSRAGWPLVVKVVAAIVLVPTAGLHLLCWGINSIFAG